MSLETATQQKNSFDAQYARREKIPVAGGMAEVVDIKPEKQKDDVPLYFSPSWALGIEHYKPMYKEWAAAGRRVVSMDSPRRGGDLKAAAERLAVGKDQAYFDEIQKIVDEHPEAEVRKAFNMLDALRSKGIEKTDAIAYSEGGVNTIIAALLEPQRFRNIVLYCPAGFIGKDTFLGLLDRFLLKQNEKLVEQPGVPVSDEERAEAQRAGRTIAEYAALPVSEGRTHAAQTAVPSMVNYLKANPVRAISEIHAISQSQVHGALKYLREQGIRISIMTSVEDPVFKEEEIRKNIHADMVDGYMTIRSPGHGIGNPELYAPAMEAALTALQSKRELEAARAK
jgi:pimeloyl-ACP methyl ester carboxylesterase